MVGRIWGGDRHAFRSPKYGKQKGVPGTPFCLLPGCCLGNALSAYLLRQSFMNALRSSPFLSLASLLQAFIFSCCAVFLSPSFFRHSFMNALRSSPFLSPASLLQLVILFCCAGLASSAANAVVAARGRASIRAAISLFMLSSSKGWMDYAYCGRG